MAARGHRLPFTPLFAQDIEFQPTVASFFFFFDFMTRVCRDNAFVGDSLPKRLVGSQCEFLEPLKDN